MKLTPSNIGLLLPDGARIRINHFHSGNDSSGFIRRSLSPVENVNHTPAFASTAEITRRYPNGDMEVLGIGATVCSPKDIPSRQEGWNQAAQAALQDYLDRRS